MMARWLTLPKIAGKFRSALPGFVRFMKGANGTVTFLASLATILGVIALVANVPQFSQYFSKTFRADHYWEQQLNALNVQVNIGTFEDVLGKPTLTNSLTHDPNYVEQIFVTDRFYVTAIVDAISKVQAYSITTRSADFKPYIQRSNVTLGQSVFAANGDDPDLTGGVIDHANFMYEELYYRGNTGKELTYVYGAVQASPATNIKEDDIPRPFWRDITTIIKENCGRSHDSFYRRFPTQTSLSSSSFGDTKISHRDKAVISSVGFISPYPSFLCAIYDNEGWLPPFAPDNNQTQLLKP
jgi:hypothetical protein